MKAPPLSRPWPSCKPSSKEGNDQKGANIGSLSPYFELSESCFSNSSAAAEESEAFSTTASEASGTAGADEDAAAEALIRGLPTSDRLFYEPAGSTSSILSTAPEMTTTTTTKMRTAQGKAVDESANDAAGGGLGIEGGVAMAVDSKDPHKDFKESMEEMVMAQGVKSWVRMEEMLGWYLKLNEKSSHGIILGAFLDLLLGLPASPPPSSSSSSSSSSSNFPNPSSSSSSSSSSSLTNSSCTSFGLKII